LYYVYRVTVMLIKSQRTICEKCYRGRNFQYFTLLEGNFNQWSSSLLTVAVVHNKQTKHYWHSCPSLQEVFITIRYDTIESLTWTRKLIIQLNLAHVARN